MYAVKKPVANNIALSLAKIESRTDRCDIGQQVTLNEVLPCGFWRRFGCGYAVGVWCVCYC